MKSATSAPRQMSIPQSRDFLVQKVIARYLRDNFPVDSANPQVLVGQILYQMSSASDLKFLKLDLRKFYDTIDLRVLREKLLRLGVAVEAADLIGKACANPTAPDGPFRRDQLEARTIGVPQGLPFSNYLAEVYLEEFDSKLKGVYPGSYFRYVDDILILASDKDMQGDLDKIRSELDRLKLSLNEEKTNQGTAVDGFEYLGYKIGHGVSIRRSSRLKFENSMVKLLRSNEALSKKSIRKAAWRINLRISGCVYKGRRIGWLQYFVHTTDKTMLAEIQNMIERMLSGKKEWAFFKPKKFLKVLEILKSPSRGANSKYIPNFDNYSVGEMKSVLRDIFGYSKITLNTLTEVEIRTEFFANLGKEIISLERDIVTGYY